MSCSRLRHRASSRAGVSTRRSPSVSFCVELTSSYHDRDRPSLKTTKKHEIPPHNVLWPLKITYAGFEWLLSPRFVVLLATRCRTHPPVWSLVLLEPAYRVGVHSAKEASPVDWWTSAVYRPVPFHLVVLYRMVKCPRRCTVVGAPHVSWDDILAAGFVMIPILDT